MAIGRPITETPNIADKIISIIATAGQTEFTVTGGYRVNHLAVFRNGVRLVTGRDYIAGDGLTVELIEDASLNDVLEFQVFDTFSISDAIVGNSTSQTLTGDLTVNGTLTVGASGIGTLVLDTMNVGIISSTTGITTIQSEVAAASTSTGALQVMGGVGIGKSLYVGGNLSVGGTVTYEDVTNIDSIGIVTGGKGLRATTGGLVVTAGITTLAGLTTVTNAAALHSKQLNVSAGSTFGGAVDIEDTLSVAGVLDIADYIKHTGDTNTAIRFPADDTITAETAGTERFRITSDGKYYFPGTGAGSGARGLEIDTETVGAADEGVILNARASGSTGRIKFQTNSKDAMTILGNGGSIGMGTDNPAFPSGSGLEIHASSNPRLKLTNSTTGVSGTDGTQLYLSSDGDTILDNKDSKDIIFHTDATEKVRLTSAGDFCVGKTSATGKAEIATSASEIGLTVSNSVHDSQLQIMASASNKNSSIFFGDGGDGNIGHIDYDHNDNNLNFRVNAAERLRITSAGVIGIGTEAPYTNGLLHCDGNLVLTSSGNAPKIIFDEYSSGTDPKAQIAMDQESSTAASLRFYTEGSGTLTQRLMITSGGDLKLGTTNNTASSDSAHYIFTICGKSGQTGAGAIDFQDYAGNSDANLSADSGNLTITADYDDGTADSSIRFRVDGSSEKMRLNDDGQLGIGTADPLPGVSQPGIEICNTSADDCRLKFTAASSKVSQIGYYGLNRFGMDLWDGLEIRDSSAGYATRFKCDENGDMWCDASIDGDHTVYIRNMSTTATSSSATTNILDFKFNRSGGGINLSAAKIIVGKEQEWVGAAANQDGYMAFHTAQNEASAERMRLTSDGTLLIGSTTASTGSGTDDGGFINPYGRICMRRDDTMYIAKSLATGGYTAFQVLSAQTTVGSITFNSGGTAFNTTSDSRLKENVVDIDDGITRLKALKPKRFNYKSLPDVTQDGFIAHEAQEVLPYTVTGTKDEVATEDKPEDDIKVGDPIYQEMDYAKLTPLLTAALQEAIGKIEVLEEKVAVLESS